ncbi:2-C-methyl-D-erythritol 4-phosphate cytidylyltransferase [Cellulomonas shaoxiangyii]|uniref:2-C-methyl-D-erythritol 4-phosphate cytidylyltransferase n=1 Tax=Cellulomonas shaoxiangyii TaxID=2566013 RepID=A0A4P7SMW7_9CELL|nr:2-C-methyl-D-erythritol 4-phosphate cytidylyltransferase [Cellulomonas shaoxiangyii]QCB94596.1 2-C-methyl-D-erythritol 4-phosphate cytidylyltransferase [Cellulomonas shaoxiangyii]TGY84998.1 2-C-methyl-D-erythritol 4-phosphate cytidylyltransferase [Cellulomonas shaoxiangyii]
MSVAAVLTAAGSGSRLGHALPKAVVPVAGAPLVTHAARALLTARAADGSRVTALVVTAPAEHVHAVTQALAPVADLGVPVRVVVGGATRQASVAAGLAALPLGVEVVLVHDAARAFAPAALVARVVDAVRAGHDAVVPGLPVVDTVKRVASWDAAGGPVVDTPPREALRAVQTPQGFAHDVLVRAHAAGAHRAADEATAASDDAGLVEAAGGRVWMVPGDERAAKITTPRDVVLAEAWHAAPTPGGPS